MEKSIFNITEYRVNQDIDFTGVTSFKVLNHGESLVDINTISVYPGETTTLVEADTTFCDFNLKSVFTEDGKLPKFKVIYKQLASEAGSTDNLNQNYDYAVTLFDYQKNDIIELSQNKSGNTILMRSFDGVTFDQANNIDLGFIPANQVFKYENGGSFDTIAIKFKINIDEEIEVSEKFTVGVFEVPENAPLTIYDIHFGDFTHPTDTDGIIYFKTNTAGTYDLVLLDFNEFYSGVKTMDVTDIGVEQQMNFGAFSRENHYEGLTLAFKSFTKDEQILFALTNEEPWAIESFIQIP